MNASSSHKTYQTLYIQKTTTATLKPWHFECILYGRQFTNTILHHTLYYNINLAII